MTAQKHLKQIIRARMAKTGERYATARRHIVSSTDVASLSRIPHHFPGSVPATTALRILLTHAGIRSPHTGAPFSEAMIFGIAGGVGIGVFSFFYEVEDFAGFFVAGRHQWYDDLSYLQGALTSLGLTPIVQETSGAKTAAAQLTKAVAGGRPCIAWVDMASLPHRGMPEKLRGMTYHVITVYEVDEAKGTALIGDLTDEPIEISLEDLETARARIAKQKYRLLSIAPNEAPVPDLGTLVDDGLRRCRDGLLNPTIPQSKSNAKLEALQKWADRLTSTKDPERWERVFRHGANLWRGLNYVYLYIELYGTGGGLYRPLFADFLDEAAARTGRSELKTLAARYDELGRDWSALADASLPDDVPACRQAKDVRLRIAELRHEGGPAEEARAAWSALADLERAATASFPMSEDSSRALRAEMSARVLSLYEREAGALETLGSM
jgi:hypothetical protein